VGLLVRREIARMYPRTECDLSRRSGMSDASGMSTRWRDFTDHDFVDVAHAGPVRHISMPKQSALELSFRLPPEGRIKESDDGSLPGGIALWEGHRSGKCVARRRQEPTRDS